MTAIATEPPTTGIRSRGETYAILAHAFSFPDVSLHESIRSGQWNLQLAAALKNLPCHFRTSDLNWPRFETHDELQTEYIRIFQIGGRRGPPCPLHQGHYARDRSQVLQNLIRFYNYFGFHLKECVMPDHLSVQLEFMSLLAAGGVTDERSGLRAQRDFLGRHMTWTKELALRAAGVRPHAFYRSLTTLTARLIGEDQHFISNTLGNQCDARS